MGVCDLDILYCLLIEIDQLPAAVHQPQAAVREYLPAVEGIEEGKAEFFLQLFTAMDRVG